jgi:hypothetical protein
MIQDLKADSARWEQERRAASRAAGAGAGGTMHSSQVNGMFMRGSNSPVGAREQPRGQPDYISWKNRQLDSRSYDVAQTDRMDIEYSSPSNLVNPSYPPAPYGGAPQPPQGYPPAPYQAPVHGGSAPPYGQPYFPNPAAQYSPGPRPTDGGYPAMAAPPPIAPVYGQDATFVHGSNYSAAGYPAPNRMNPMSMSTAPQSRGFSATAGGPAYPEDAFAGYGAAAGNPVNPLQYQVSSLANPTDPGYGRAPGGAYNTTTTSPNPPQAASDDTGSLAGTAPPRQSYSAGPEPSFDERQSPSLPNAPTPTNGSSSQIPPGAPPARRDPDARDRDHREHRARRSEPDREDRHAAERARHRHGHR